MWDGNPTDGPRFSRFIEKWNTLGGPDDGNSGRAWNKCKKSQQERSNWKHYGSIKSFSCNRSCSQSFLPSSLQQLSGKDALLKHLTTAEYVNTIKYISLLFLRIALSVSLLSWLSSLCELQRYGFPSLFLYRVEIAVACIKCGCSGLDLCLWCVPEASPLILMPKHS